MKQPRSPQFGALLFRANELIGTQGAAVFDRLGIGLHASKISIVLALHHHGPLTSTELARHIGHSRQLIETKLKSSVADGFFVSRTDPEDSRRRIYDFADGARAEAARILSVMVDFEQVYAQLWDELGVDLESALLSMEKALASSSLTNRLRTTFPKYDQELTEDAR